MAFRNHVCTATARTDNTVCTCKPALTMKWQRGAHIVE